MKYPTPSRYTGFRRSPLSCVGLAVLAVWTHAAISVADPPDYPIPIHRDNGLANVFAKLNGGHQAKIVYIGGSVTQGWGYRDLVTQWFNNHYPGRITEINAGWSGTGSLIGSMRFARDVLVHSPDLVFIEFAVNDLPEDPMLFIERNCEGFPLQAWTQNPDTDVCFIETIAWYIEQPYLNGYYPNTVQAHYNVCDHYGCPSVNVGWALYEHVLAGTSWESLTINGDRVHPNAAGSQIYADAITAYLDTERTRGGTPASHAMPAALTDYPVMSGTITELAAIDPLPPGWVKRYNQFGAASFIESSTVGSQVSLAFEGPAAALKVVAGPDGGDVSVSIDGGPFTPAGIIYIDSYFVWALPIAKMLSFGTHTLTMRVDSATVRLINVEDADTEGGGPGPGDVNLSLTAAADAADSIYSPDFNAAKARDGLTSTKWTSTDTTQSHWLALDLRAPAQVSTFIVKHASSGGEWTVYNTRAFTIESGPSLTGPWTIEFTGSNPNQLGVSTFSYWEPARLRYVRLNISDPGIDWYARIPEFEVWGTLLPPKGDLDLDGDVDQSDYGLFQACYSPSTQTDPACELALLDDDNDVDAGDFAIFAACTTGPNVPADPDCGY